VQGYYSVALGVLLSVAASIPARAETDLTGKWVGPFWNCVDGGGRASMEVTRRQLRSNCATWTIEKEPRAQVVRCCGKPDPPPIRPRLGAPASKALAGPNV
jgi:hypothetical protein